MTKKLNKKNILFGVSALMAILTIFVTLSTVVSGIEISNLNNKEVKLLEESKLIEEDIVKKTSTSVLLAKSSEYGFEKVNQVFYLTKVDAVAKLP